MENKKVKVGVIGHIDHGKQTLAAAIARELAEYDEYQTIFLQDISPPRITAYMFPMGGESWVGEDKGRRKGQRRSRRGF
jgi:hypothetical protein